MLASRTVVASLSALTLLGASLQARAAAILQDVSIYTDAGSIIFPVYPGDSYSTNFGTNQNQLLSVPGYIDAAAAEVLTDGAGDRGYDQEDTLSNLTSPTAGTVDFSGGSTALDVSPDGLVQSANSGSSFDYDFQLTSKYLLTVDFATFETDGFDPANYLQVIRTDGLYPPLAAFNPPDNSVGSFSYLLNPGLYELGITSELGDTTDAIGPGFSLGAHLEEYTFELASAAPEPSTWALMIVGIGGVGLILRRARKSMGLRSKDALSV